VFSDIKKVTFFKYVSESDSFGPTGNLSDIKNLLSFEKELFKDSRYN